MDDRLSVVRLRSGDSGLGQASQTLRTLFRASPLGIVSIDQEGVVQVWNQAAEEIFGWREDEVLGRPIPIVPEEDLPTARQLRDQVFEGEVFTGLEALRRRKDGSVVEVSMSLAPIRVGPGEVTGMVAFIEDLSSRSQDEDRIRQRLAVEQALALASRNFVSTEIPDLDRILGAFAEAVDADRAYIFQAFDGSGELIRSHRWSRDHDEPEGGLLRSLPIERAGVLLDRMQAGDHVAVCDTASFADGPDGVAEVLRRLGIRSILLVPIRSPDEELLGFIGFDDLRSPRPWPDEDVQAIRIFAEMLATYVVRDRAQDALREHRARLQLMAEQVPAVLWTTDRELRFTSSIGAGLANLGLAADDVKGKTLFEYFETDDPDCMPIRQHRLAIEGESVSYSYDWQGRSFQVFLQPFHDGRGDVAGAIGIALDVTDRKQAEETTRRQRKYLGALVDSNPLAIVTLDEENRIVECNPAFEELFGYEEGEIVGEFLDPLIVPAHDANTGRRLSDRAQKGELVRYESRRRRKDGALVDVDIYGVPVVVDDEQIGIFGIYKDITDRKQQERQVQAQLRRQSVLRNISAAITSTLDLDHTLDVLLDQIIQKLHADAVDVLLLNPETETLKFAAGRGFRTAALQHTRLSLGEGYAGRAAQKRCIVTIDDLEEDAGDLGRAPLLEQEGFRTYFAAPVVAKGKVKGVLEIFYRNAFASDDAWLEFVEAVATQAAIAIDNAKLFDDLERSHEELSAAYDTTLEGWSRALELRDQETEGHTQRVTRMTVRLARALGVDNDEIEHIRRGALLHDIGKMAIPDSILLKEGSLDDDEWEIMRKHPVYAYELLSPIGYLRPALDIPYYHHERWDGTGYPRGLAGEEIPIAARVFAVVDVWDALRSDRPYRDAWPREKVVEYLREQAGKHFDPEIVEIFLEQGIPD